MGSCRLTRCRRRRALKSTRCPSNAALCAAYFQQTRGRAELTDQFVMAATPAASGADAVDRRDGRRWAERSLARSALVAGPTPVHAMAKEPQEGGDDDGRGTGTAVITRTRTQTRRPSMYRVLLLNDDYTPMEFVDRRPAQVLQQEGRRGDADHAARSSERRGRVRRFHLRSCGDQGDAGDGLRSKTPASAAMHHGKEVEDEAMPSFSRNLEQSLHRALAVANERHHEYATLEHLLLSLTEDARRPPCCAPARSISTC